MSTKQLHTLWLRSAAQFTTAHQQLEEEILRMRERNVAQEYIDKKDMQVEMLVDFFNQTDELLQAYRLALANATFENKIMADIISRHVAIRDIIDYKPSATK